MTKTSAPLFATTGVLAGATLLLALTGCVAGGVASNTGSYGGTSVSASVALNDDYDYYPGYETYYSRNRHEYVYRDGNSWVRRPEPFGVKREELSSAPVVRMDFHDSPEQHHAAVVQRYPRTWKGADDKHDEHHDNDRR